MTTMSPNMHAHAARTQPPPGTDMGLPRGPGPGQNASPTVKTLPRSSIPANGSTQLNRAHAKAIDTATVATPDSTAARSAIVPVSTGKPALIRYGCYEFNLKNDLTLWEYNVSFERPAKVDEFKDGVAGGNAKDVMGKRLKRELVASVLKVIGTPAAVLRAFDGSGTLVATQKLEKLLNKDWTSENLTAAADFKEAFTDITVRFKQSAKLFDTGADPKTATSFCKSLKILLQYREIDGKPGIAYGKNRLFPLPSKAVSLSEGDVEYLRRYYLNVQNIDGKVVVTANACAVACHKRGPLLQSIDGYATKPASELNALVKNLRVTTDYLGGGRECSRTIAGLATVPFLGAGADVVRFLREDGKTGKMEVITVKDYFATQRSSVKLNDSWPALVNVGTKMRSTFLPPECCKVVPGQLYRGKLTPSQAASLQNYTALLQKLTPDTIQAGLQLIGTVGNPYDLNLAKTGNPVQTADMKVSILAPPKVLTQIDNRERDAVSGNQGLKVSGASCQHRGWNSKNQKFCTIAKPERWTILYLSTGKGSPLKREAQFGEAMEGCIPDWYFKTTLGFVEPPADAKYQTQSRTARRGFKLHVPHNSSGPNSVLSKEVEAVVKAIVSKDAKIDFVLVILPKKCEVLHSLVKHHLEREHGIRSIVLAGPRVESLLKNTEYGPGEKQIKKLGSRQFFANVAMKMNLKFGGTNQKLSSSDLAPFSTGSAVFIGLSVVPDAIEINGVKQTVAAAVINRDGDYAQWPARFVMEPTQAESSGLQHLFEDLLAAHKSLNKSKKTIYNIVVYCNAGPSNHKAHGLDAAKIALAEASKKGSNVNAKVNMVFILVGKGHSTRFNVSASATGANSLPTDGGVIDVSNSSKGMVGEFYLQAHSGSKCEKNKLYKGLFNTIARPTHYSVIENRYGPSVEDLKKVSHALSYQVGTATRAVSLCAPSHYASLALDRATASLKLQNAMGWQPKTISEQETPSKTLAKGIANLSLDLSTAKNGHPAPPTTPPKSQNKSPNTADTQGRTNNVFPQTGTNRSGHATQTPQKVQKSAVNASAGPDQPRIVHDNLKNTMFYV